MDEPRNPFKFDPDLDPAFSEDIEVEDETDEAPSREELAWELASILDDLTVEQLDELVTKNVPLEALEFFTSYAEDFSEGLPIAESIRERLPNLMLLGYLLRVLEDRLGVEPGTFHA